MCPKSVCDLENGKENYKVEKSNTKYYKLSPLLTGLACDCDVQPKRRSDLPTTNKAIYIDEALTKIKFGKFNYILIFVCGMCLVAVVMETLSVSYIMPVSECDLNLSTSEKGIISASSFFGIICSSHLWGYLSDTKGRRRVLQPALLITCALSVCSSISQDFYTFTILRFLVGFFICASSSTVYAYLGEFHDNVQRCRAIMGSAIIFGIGGMLLPFVAWLIINHEWSFYIPFLDLEYKPWRLFLIVCSLPGFFCAVAFVFLPESPKFVLGLGNQSEAIEIIEKINRWNNGRNASPKIVELNEEPESIENRRRILDNKKNSRFPLLKSIWDQTAPLFQPPYLSPTLLICVIQFMLYFTANGVYMWLPEILNRVAMNLDNVDDQYSKMCKLINMMPANASVISVEGEAGCYNTKLELDTLEQSFMLEIMYACGFALIGLLINIIGKFIILITLISVCGLAGILCAYIDIPIVYISSFLVLMCVGMGINVINAATVEIYPTNFRAMAVSISLMIGRFGCIAGSNMVALVIDDYCDSIFLISGFSLIGTCILVFFVPKIHDKVSKSDIRIEPRTSISSRI